MSENYKKWMAYELAWIAGYRRKLMRTTTHITIPAVLVFMTAFLGLLSFVDRMDPADAFYGGLGGFLAGAAICGFFYLCLRFGLRSSKYQRLIQRAVEGLELPPGEEEQLVSELLAAVDNPKQRFYFEMNSMNSKGTPARFVLTPHYACLFGGYPYAILVRLADIGEIRPGEEKKLETRRGAATRTASLLTLHSIGFYRKDRADRGFGPEDLPDEAMGFFSQRIRDQALEMLRAQTGLVRSSAE